MLSTLLLSSAALAAAPSLQDDSKWAVHADKVYTSTGKVHENALIVVEDGRIRAISPGVEATRDALKAAVVTAGMIDASSRLNTGFSSVEQSSEVTPKIDVRLGIDLFDPRWKRLASSGVTTAFVAPFNRNCIGGMGAAFKTAGPASSEARFVEGAPLLCGAIGSEPSRGNSPAFGRPRTFYNRRPTTRMGVEWEWRRSFFEAAQTDDPSEEQEVLRDVLAGKIGVYVQAFATQDIRTAVFLEEEMAREGFGEMRIVIDAGAEAWREPDMLVRTDTAVILPPLPSQGRTTDQALMPIDCAKQLTDAGIAIALSAHSGDDPSQRLDVQAGYAMRGGLTREQALAAVTITPAQMLGIEARVGSIEVGKDADLVLWNGEPFEATTRPIGVLVGGRLARDPR